MQYSKDFPKIILQYVTKKKSLHYGFFTHANHLNLFVNTAAIEKIRARTVL